MVASELGECQLRSFRRPGSGGHLTNAVCGTPARGPACRSVAASGGARWAGPGAGPRGAGRAGRPGPFSPGRLAEAGLGADAEHPYAVLVAGMTGTPYVFPKRSCAADLGPKLYARPPDLSRLAYPLPYNFGPKLGGAPGMAGRVKRMWSLGRARFAAGPPGLTDRWIQAKRSRASTAAALSGASGARRIWA